MEIELNRLITHFANTPFKIRGVYHYTIEPGTAGRERGAPYPGFIFPLSGEAEYYFNGEPYRTYPGNVVHGGADMRLDKRVIGDTKWEYVCVLYQVCGAEPPDLRLSALHTELTTGRSTRLTELLHRLRDISSQPGGLPAFRREMLFRCVLDEVFACALNQAEKGAGRLFEKVSAYIHEHYHETISIHELARQNEVSENQLYYVFQKYAGMGAGQYLISYRMNRAREMLVTGGLSVREVAAAVGYPDALYFSRSFRRCFGRSPSEARKNQE